MRQDSPKRLPWSPFFRLRWLQDEMNRLFDQDYPDLAAPRHGDQEVNIRETDGAVVVAAQLPGVRPEDMEVSAQGGALILQGTRAADPDAESEDATWHLRERPTGAFYYTVAPGHRFRADDVRASLHDGILRVELVRPEEDLPKKITVRSS